MAGWRGANKHEAAVWSLRQMNCLEWKVTYA
ncbi:hypothetical protein E2C01_068500 [Portunus trituberculatus]|uniref:Uncharacterized protein n=1 Tax=Portunus trituberculatus TaxID=210409 RepID=A0A5B7HMK0_PORTR|nr:hypothetical protein [Portunus trituberculatus]